jgi:hypothetical protein
MTNSEIIKDVRYRRAVLSGEYYRCVSVFLMIQFPGREDLDHLPKDIVMNAQVCVDNSLISKYQAQREMAQEMR